MTFRSYIILEFQVLLFSFIRSLTGIHHVNLRKKQIFFLFFFNDSFTGFSIKPLKALFYVDRDLKEIMFLVEIRMLQFSSFLERLIKASAIF